jgi:hypothetical protein
MRSRRDGRVGESYGGRRLPFGIVVRLITNEGPALAVTQIRSLAESTLPARAVCNLIEREL